MRPFVSLALMLVACLSTAVPVSAQEAMPPIGPFVVDVHGVIPIFPNDPQLAQSRGISPTQLPRMGIGADVGVHVYLLKWKAITFGIGGQAIVTRARRTPAVTAAVEPVTEKFRSIAPQLSFNFGSGKGWSYLSGGIGPSNWSVVPNGREPFVADTERLKTINYGGGARWFAKNHLAFSFDVRFYAINPSTASFGLPNGPRSTFTVLGAGVSLK